jgi:16S rRNA (cytosine1402-N4)-methyltransferase
MSTHVPAPHVPVLLHETVSALNAQAAGIYVDGTFGRGGHSRYLLQSPCARLIAFDKDPVAVDYALQGPQAIQDGRFQICHASFADMQMQLQDLGITQVQGVMLDLGVSSPQIDTPERGFSFRHDGPLDMRMNSQMGMTAAEFLEQAPERQIAQVIRDYGEERFAGAIAKAIVACREAGQRLRSTRALAELVGRVVKTREPGKDPATRTFQALRIHVNAELEELQQGLKAAAQILAPAGRIAVISFHSLEDRIVKSFFAQYSRFELDRRMPFVMPPDMPLKLVARIKPGDEEVAANPRARSAVLRVAERTHAPWVEMDQRGGVR